MSKRSWTEDNSSGMFGSARHSTATRRQLSLSSSPHHVNTPSLPLAANVSVPRDGNSDSNGGQRHADTSPNVRPMSQGSQIGVQLQPSKATGPSADDTQTTQPGITRKVKACAACRKQKIKCIMPNDQPPCTRCVRRNLSCVLNKSLQSLIEDTRQTNILHSDVSQIHAVLTEVCKRIDLAPPPPLQTGGKDNVMNHQAKDMSPPSDGDQEGNYEPSPPQSPPDSALAQAPIESFRRIAQLASPRSAALSHDQGFERGRQCAGNDLISKGIISVATAERLLHRYLQKLDPYIYGLGSIYPDLQTLRQASPALTACICTVAALHDEGDNSELYEICNHEFRRIISKALFEKRDTQFLLALTVGSYWLSDIARILSGDAIRRAADLRLQRYYYQLLDSDPQKMALDASRKLVCGVRLWYLLYICDQHLAILYNQRSTMREQDTVTGWEAYLESRQGADTDADSDMRISSQVALLLIMSRIRETFGSDTCEPIPKASVAQLNVFSRQIDQWLSRWGTALRPNQYVGDFPTKGVNLHYQFAKLHLFHHVFRGLRSGDTSGSVLPIPGYFRPAALGAVSAAISILEFLLHDADLRNSLIGVPHYFHTMITFAGHFLLEASTKYGEQLSSDQSYIFSLIQDIIHLFYTTPCIEQHPIHRMAVGLDRKLQDCQRTKSEPTIYSNQSNIHPDLAFAPRENASYWSMDNGSTNQTYRNQPPLNYAGDEDFATLHDTSDLSLSFPAFGEFDYPDMRMNFLL